MLRVAARLLPDDERDWKISQNNTFNALLMSTMRRDTEGADAVCRLGARRNQ